MIFPGCSDVWVNRKQLLHDKEPPKRHLKWQTLFHHSLHLSHFLFQNNITWSRSGSSKRRKVSLHRHTWPDLSFCHQNVIFDPRQISDFGRNRPTFYRTQLETKRVVDISIFVANIINGKPQTVLSFLPSPSSSIRTLELIIAEIRE